MRILLSFILQIWNFLFVFFIQHTMKENFDFILLVLSIVLTIVTIIKMIKDIIKK